MKITDKIIIELHKLCDEHAREDFRLAITMAIKVIKNLEKDTTLKFNPINFDNYRNNMDTVFGKVSGAYISEVSVRRMIEESLKWFSDQLDRR
jgi:hypothetical protein